MAAQRILIRPAEADDTEALIALGTASCLSSIDDLPEFRNRKDEMEPAFARFIPADLDRIVVLEAGGDLAGFVTAQAQTGEITDLWVDPARQNAGLGAILLASAEAEIRKAGHNCAWLTTHERNRRALRFYQTQGYTLLSITEAPGETLPDVTYPRALLGKQLSRPDAAKAFSMADVRQGIDTLDPMLVALIAERFSFIDRAADLKPSLTMPARVTERVEEVVANARTQAKDLGFDPDLTETLWRTMVDLAIAREERMMLAAKQEEIA